MAILYRIPSLSINDSKYMIDNLSIARLIVLTYLSPSYDTRQKLSTSADEE